MTMIKENKGVIIFYMMVVVCTVMMMARTRELDRFEKINNNEFVYNTIQK